MEILFPVLRVFFAKEFHDLCSHHRTPTNEKRAMLLPPKPVSVIPEIQKWLTAAEQWPSHNSIA